MKPWNSFNVVAVPARMDFDRGFAGPASIARDREVSVYADCSEGYGADWMPTVYTLTRSDDWRRKITGSSTSS